MNNFLKITELAFHFEIKPRQMNFILDGLDWIKRTHDNIVLTVFGLSAGGIQRYSDKYHVYYILWDISLLKNKDLILAVNEFKLKKSNKQKGTEYEKHVAHVYRERGYSVWEYGRDKGLLDHGIDLIAKKEDELIFIQCKNWKSNSKYKIDHIMIKASRAEARAFLKERPFFNQKNLAFKYVISTDCMHSSAKKYIEENKELFQYEIIPYDS